MGPSGIDAIVIGGSAGAIEALSMILSALPKTFPIPVAIVVHVPPTGADALVEVLATNCSLAVREARDKEALAGGTVYVAPPNYHLLVEKERCFSLSADEPVLYSRPAIDVLFESAADAYGASLAGLVLTGASEDGARGLSRIAQAGGTTVVQSPESAVAATMPAAALRLVRPDRVLPLADIGPFLAGLYA